MIIKNWYVLKILKFFISPFILFPAYVLFNNLVLHINSLFLSISPHYLFVGTVCTMDDPLSLNSNQNILNILLIPILRNVILIAPIVFLIFKRVMLFRLLFFFVVSFSVLDLFGVLSYSIDNLTGSNYLFRLHLSHSNFYLLSKYLDLPKITIPLVCIFIWALGYFIFREKLSKVNLKNDIAYSIVSSFFSLGIYYFLVKNFSP